MPVKPKQGLVAFASCRLDKKFYVGEIGVYTRPDGSGFRLLYPTWKVNDSNIPIFYPIRKDVGKAITEAIADKLETLLAAKLTQSKPAVSR